MANVRAVGIVRLGLLFYLTPAFVCEEHAQRGGVSGGREGEGSGRRAVNSLLPWLVKHLVEGMLRGREGLGFFVCLREIGDDILSCAGDTTERHAHITPR